MNECLRKVKLKYQKFVFKKISEMLNNYRELNSFFILDYNFCLYILLARIGISGVAGGGGMNWEIAIDIYTVICIK